MIKFYSAIIRFICLVIFSCIIINLTYSQDPLKITDFGISPGDTANVVPAFKNALKACAGKKDPVIVFPNGEYHFRKVSDSEVEPGILLNGISNLTIDGEGSEFIFHGKMQAVSMYNCSDIDLRNFTVDWDETFIYQGEIIGVEKNFIDIGFDEDLYPYIIDDNTFYLKGDAVKIKPVKVNFYLCNHESGEFIHDIIERKNDGIINDKAVEIKPGIVRFYGTENQYLQPGTIITFVAAGYITTGISIVESKNVQLSQINLYHALGDGVAAARSENISLNNVNITINKNKERVFSTIGNASRFINCRGNIRISECSHTGADGYFTKIHGEYIGIDTVISKNMLISSQLWAVRPGEDVWFVESETHQRSGTGTIRQKQPLMKNNRISAAALMFSQPLPRNLDQDDYLESKKWIPNVRISNCKLMPGNSRGGIQINVPGKIVIEDNYFNTIGPAIAINGGLDSLRESGACNDVTIRNNIFEENNSHNINYAEKNSHADGIISIKPLMGPVNSKSQPFHKNIRIDNNTFKTSFSPLLYGRLTSDLSFTNNEVEFTKKAKKKAGKNPAFSLNACRNIIISNNNIDKKYPFGIVELRNMSSSEIQTNEFKIQIK